MTSTSTNSDAKLDEWLRINRDTTHIDVICKEINERAKQVKQHLSTRRPPDIFYAFCMKLFDRVFGENTTLCECPNGWTISYDKNGWLKKLLPASSSSSSSIRSSSSSGGEYYPPSYSSPGNYASSSSSSSGDGLHKLIATLSGDLLYVLMECNKTFDVTVSMLPKKNQWYLLRDPIYPAVESELSHVQKSSLFLLKHLLPMQRSGTTITLDAFEYFLVCLLRYPTIVMIDEKNHAVGEPKDWLKTNAYLVLLKKLIDDLLDSSHMQVHTPGSSSSSSLSGSGSGGRSGGMKTPIGAGKSSHGSTPGSGMSPGGSLTNLVDIKHPSSHARLFLTLAVEYWMDTAKLVRHHGEYLKYEHEKANTRKGGGQPGPTSQYVRHNGIVHEQYDSPMVTILLDTGKNSLPWSVSTLQSSYVLVQKVLSDSTLCHQYKAVSETIRLEINRRRHGTISPSHLSSSSSMGNNRMEEISPCPPCMEIIQQPLYDMLRCIFNQGGEMVSCTTFCLAVDLWLLYIQPWKQQTMVDKEYSDTWRTYVAANLHFYTTLLACFLKTAARVDLSPSMNPKESTYFQSVERVLEVFLKDSLVLTIDHLLGDFLDWYPAYLNHQTNINPKKTTMAQMEAVRAQHVILYPDRTIDKPEFYGRFSFFCFGTVSF